LALAAVGPSPIDVAGGRAFTTAKEVEL